MTGPRLHIAAHPVRSQPYDKLQFVSLNPHGVPLYRVEGVDGGAWGAWRALERAFGRYGGACFYCGRRFEPQPFSHDTAHRDHVVPRKEDGANLLHNLVIACGNCGRAKAADPIYEFMPKAAKKYLAALEAHLSQCVRERPDA